MALGHKWLRFFKKRSPSLGKINGTRGYSRKCATHSDLTLFNAEWDEPWNIIEPCPTLPPALKRVGSLWVAHGVAVSCGRACAIYFPQRRNPLTPSTQYVTDALPASRRRKFCLESLNVLQVARSAPRKHKDLRHSGICFFFLRQGV